MRVLVDTSVWSLALRKKRPSYDDQAIITELKELIRDVRVVMIGPIRQELLSGIADDGQYRRLRTKLEAFDDLFIHQRDYEEAAAIYNRCRSKGIQGSHTDFLMCAVAIQRDFSVFTVDRDFEYYARHVSVRLYSR